MKNIVIKRNLKFAKQKTSSEVLSCTHCAAGRTSGLRLPLFELAVRLCTALKHRCIFYILILLQERELVSQNTTHPRVCGLQYPPKVDISNQHNPQGWAYRWHCGSSAFRPDAISAPTTVPGNPSGSPRFRDT